MEIVKIFGKRKSLNWFELRDLCKRKLHFTNNEFAKKLADAEISMLLKHDEKTQKVILLTPSV